MGFFFVQLKPWEERTAARHTAASRDAGAQPGVRAGHPRSGGASPSARRRFPASAPAPGSRFELQDRSGGTPEYLAEQTQAFIEAARKRPEIGRINSLYRASVPQIYADIDREQGDQVGRAAGRRQHHARGAARQLVRERFQQVRPRLQGLRAGRAGVPARSEAARAVLRPQPGRRHGAARYAGHDAAERRAGVHQPVQPVPHGRDHRRAGRRLLVGAGARRARSRPRATCCRRT